MTPPVTGAHYRSSPAPGAHLPSIPPNTSAMPPPLPSLPSGLMSFASSSRKSGSKEPDRHQSSFTVSSLRARSKMPVTGRDPLDAFKGLACPLSPSLYSPSTRNQSPFTASPSRVHSRTPAAQDDPLDAFKSLARPPSPFLYSPSARSQSPSTASPSRARSRTPAAFRRLDHTPLPSRSRGLQGWQDLDMRRDVGPSSMAYAPTRHPASVALHTRRTPFTLSLVPSSERAKEKTPAIPKRSPASSFSSDGRQKARRVDSAPMQVKLQTSQLMGRQSSASYGNPHLAEEGMASEADPNETTYPPSPSRVGPSGLRIQNIGLLNPAKQQDIPARAREPAHRQIFSAPLLTMNLARKLATSVGAPVLTRQGLEPSLSQNIEQEQLITFAEVPQFSQQRREPDLLQVPAVPLDTNNSLTTYHEQLLQLSEGGVGYPPTAVNPGPQEDSNENIFDEDDSDEMISLDHIKGSSDEEGGNGDAGREDGENNGDSHAGGEEDGASRDSSAGGEEDMMDVGSDRDKEGGSSDSESDKAAAVVDVVRYIKKLTKAVKSNQDCLEKLCAHLSKDSRGNRVGSGSRSEVSEEDIRLPGVKVPSGNINHRDPIKTALQASNSRNKTRTVRAHVEELLDLREKTDLPLPPNALTLSDFHAKRHPGCTIDNFVIDLEHNPASAWNKRAMKVFADHFMATHEIEHTRENKAQVERTLYAWIRGKHLKFQLRTTNPESEEVLKRRAARQQRKRALWHRRLIAVSRHPALLRHLNIVKRLNVNGMSSDESELDEETHRVRYYIVVPGWRHPSLANFLRALDIVYMLYRLDDLGNVGKGNQPHERIATDAIRDPPGVEGGGNSTGAVKELPWNCYDPDWLEQLDEGQIYSLNVKNNEEYDFRHEE
ncbi:hypothetical protein BOTBODRAFT_49423 [Botryobasidium botryosum FD-172 SS1]|uniref:Uncharacterized protein n=1 Tax=Botryobasidium botryosum (strain FD-172 SS1) TaxID=930990 RepID=A0A067LTH4_BOTB1|nr:hypothetical protein BOTBODRAFT_49423 [Botryobasidium botryosum FD-172 SS1]